MVNSDGSIQLIQDLGYPPGLPFETQTIHVRLNNGGGEGPDTLLTFEQLVKFK